MHSQYMYIHLFINYIHVPVYQCYVYNETYAKTEMIKTSFMGGNEDNGSLINYSRQSRHSLGKTNLSLITNWLESKK